MDCDFPFGVAGAEELSSIPHGMGLYSCSSFMYCFVHEAFDQPRPTQRAMIPNIEHPAVTHVPVSTPQR